MVSQVQLDACGLAEGLYNHLSAANYLAFLLRWWPLVIVPILVRTRRTGAVDHRVTKPLQVLRRIRHHQSRHGQDRRSEGAEWFEIDLETATWTVPAARMKARREHRVPLSERALAILKEAKGLSDGEGFIFPNKRSGKPITNMGLTRMLERLEIPAVPHGNACPILSLYRHSIA